MIQEYKFNQLLVAQKVQAEAMFLNAGIDDGYLYQLGADGKVLCRRRHVDLPRTRLLITDAAIDAAREE